MKKDRNETPIRDLRRRLLHCLPVRVLGLLLVFPTLLPRQGPAQQKQSSATLSLSPAVIRADGTFGQSLTQSLKINNQTSNSFEFDMVAEDVGLRDNKRVFFMPGELPNSIAASAVFSNKELTVGPFATASVDVTLTIPEKTDIRAVVAIFRGKNHLQPGTNSVGLVASMGTLITFHLTTDKSLKADPLQVELPTETTNLAFDQTLANTGSEPLLPEGVLAILGADGKMVGKARFTSVRLLPGEKQVFRAEYPDPLPPGSYQALCTFEFDGKTNSQSVSFVIK